MCLSENAGEDLEKVVVYHNVFHLKMLNQDFFLVKPMFGHTSIQNVHVPSNTHVIPDLTWQHPLGSLGHGPGRPAAPHELCVAQRFRELASLDHGLPAERMKIG